MIKTIVRKLDSWKTYNRTVRELQALSSRELTDLGISRDEIQSIAKKHATMNF